MIEFNFLWVFLENFVAVAMLSFTAFFASLILGIGWQYGKRIADDRLDDEDEPGGAERSK